MPSSVRDDAGHRRAATTMGLFLEWACGKVNAHVSGGERLSGGSAPAEARFEKGVVISGHMIDLPGRTPPRFPPEAEGPVRQAMERVLTDRGVGQRDLAITGGARGADILGAELCLARGSAVWLLVPLPEREFLERSVRLPGSDWVERFHALKYRCTVRYQQDELGPPPLGQSPFARNNQWCLDTGRAVVGDERLLGLVVWDEQPTDREGGATDFVARATKCGVQIEIVNPTAL